MSLTTQDFNKGLDLSEQTEIHGTQINQMIDVCRPASDKGLVIETTDTAEDTPEVPDPNTELESVTPIWWKRYIWKRNLYTSGVYCYVWDENATSADPLLKWIRVDQDAADAASDASDADLAAQAALAAANAAQSEAEAATTRANDAYDQAVIAQSMATDAQTKADSIVGSSLKTGMIMPFIGTTVFSTSQDDGWLELNGSTVAKATFEGLAAVLGETGVTFTLPDWRGRAIIGAGQGSGLTSRLNKTVGGSETVILNASQVYHKHVMGKRESESSSFFRFFTTGAFTNLITVLSSAFARNRFYNDSTTTGTGETEGNLITSEPVEEGGAASSPHDNMMPWAAARWLIKT